MEFSIKLHVVINSGWYIVHIEGSKVIISKIYFFLILKIDFVLADTNEMSLFCGISSVSSHCLTKYSFRGFRSTKGLDTTSLSMVYAINGKPD